MFERSGGTLSFEDGAVYPLLHEYERQGLVEGYWEQETAAETEDAAPRKGPRRRYYRLTPRGGDALRASLAEWQSFSDAVWRVLGQPESGLAVGGFVGGGGK